MYREFRAGQIKISTHTLTWSVTIPRSAAEFDKNFNSHAHVERDLAMNSIGYDYGNFNSHAHVERDTPPMIYKTYVRYFNSHAHVERDDYVLAVEFVLFISTHTLTWSVTFEKYFTDIYDGFQLTRSRGA